MHSPPKQPEATDSDIALYRSLYPSMFEGTPAAKPAEPVAPAQAASVPPAAKTSLELKLPDGMKADDPDVVEFRAIASKLGLEGEKAQHMFDVQVAAFKAPYEAAAKEVAEWRRRQKRTARSAAPCSRSRWTLRGPSCRSSAHPRCARCSPQASGITQRCCAYSRAWAGRFKQHERMRCIDVYQLRPDQVGRASSTITSQPRLTRKYWNADGTQTEYGAQEQLRKSAGWNSPPGDVPDLTDTQVRARKQAMALQLMSGRGRKTMFSSGPYGDAFTSNDSLLGGG